MTRKCPYCGEPVPTFSVNCPKCYKKIPREDEKQEEDIRGHIPDDKSPAIKSVNKTIVLILALIPAAFGIMGMAQMYEKEYKKGGLFLCVGFPLFLFMMFLISTFGQYGTGAMFLSLGLTILCGVAFAVIYLIQAFDAIIRSLFRF